MEQRRPGDSDGHIAGDATFEAARDATLDELLAVVGPDLPVLFADLPVIHAGRFSSEESTSPERLAAVNAQLHHWAATRPQVDVFAYRGTLESAEAESRQPACRRRPPRHPATRGTRPPDLRRPAARPGPGDAFPARGELARGRESRHTATVGMSDLIAVDMSDLDVDLAEKFAVLQHELRRLDNVRRGVQRRRRLGVPGRRRPAHTRPGRRPCRHGRLAVARRRRGSRLPGAGRRVGPALDTGRDRRDGARRLPPQRHRSVLPLQGRVDGRGRPDRGRRRCGRRPRRQCRRSR